MKQGLAHGGTKRGIGIGIGIGVMRRVFSRAVWCLLSFEVLKFLPYDSTAMFRSGPDSRPRWITRFGSPE